jgi:predicted DNA-binding protein (MmcQ/YjbR family)
MSKSDPFLTRLRQICFALPEVQEVVTWGHPTFKAGKKTFAVYEEYKGIPSLAVSTGLDAQAALIRDPRFYVTPYIGSKGWTSLRVDGRVRWSEVRALVVASYRLAAPPRLVGALSPRKRS